MVPSHALHGAVTGFTFVARIPSLFMPLLRQVTSSILTFLMATLHISTFLCVTHSLLATSPLLLLEPATSLHKVLKDAKHLSEV